jgi:6-pyruvoyltetrahydropterin/6-carboxytetrahydropterin synthase
VKLGIVDHIDCAHFLPAHPKCGRLHGHTYKIEMTIEGETGSDGMVLDFDQMKKDLVSVLGRYDHQSLNDFLDYPSVENICELLASKLRPTFKFPFTLRVWEGEGKWAELESDKT